MRVPTPTSPTLHANACSNCLCCLFVLFVSGFFHTYADVVFDDGDADRLGTTVYTAFARFDAWTVNPDDGCDYDDSGRLCYVTDDETDAQRVFDTWCDGGFHPDVYTLSVRRGGVERHRDVTEPYVQTLLCAADDVSWSETLNHVFNPPVERVDVDPVVSRPAR